MCMEYKEVKLLVDDSLKPVLKEISEIKDTVKPIPALCEQLSGYRDMEDAVRAHEFILNGVKDKPETGILYDIKQLKKQGEKSFNWIVKIVAFLGTVIALVAAIKAFFF